MLAGHLDEGRVAFGSGAKPVGLVPVRAEQLSERIAELERDAHAIRTLDGRVGIAQIVRVDDRHEVSGQHFRNRRKGTNAQGCAQGGFHRFGNTFRKDRYRGPARPITCPQDWKPQ